MNNNIKIYYRFLIGAISLLLLTGCCGWFIERAFVKKYEFEDFSQFENVHIFIRSADRGGDQVIMIDAPDLQYDSLRSGLYIVNLNKHNHQIISTKWTLTDDYVNADTVKLQQLVQAFIKYEIPRLDVDESGNVFVYMRDVETLASARFVDENALLKYPKWKWSRYKGNWYKPK